MIGMEIMEGMLAIRIKIQTTNSKTETSIEAEILKQTISSDIIGITIEIKILTT